MPRRSNGPLYPRTISTRISPDVETAVEKIAKESGTSISDWCRVAVEQRLQRHQAVERASAARVRRPKPHQIELARLREEAMPRLEARIEALAGKVEPGDVDRVVHAFAWLRRQIALAVAGAPLDPEEDAS